MVEPIELEWPAAPQVYLTIDYECDYGTALEKNTFQALTHTEQLVDLLESLDVPLTCFIQTEVLEAKPEEVEKLREADIDVAFHPHSHTHKPRGETDIEAEIRKSTATFEDYFGQSPTGYRFPNGNIRPEDYCALDEQGYAFDASVFPSWRPGHFDNRDASLTPVYLSDHDLYEIPFTVFSDALRIPTALSYCRLIGRPFTELLLRRPPETMIFNIHMHDLVNPPAFSDLSRFYQGIYSRNTNAKSLLKRVLSRFQAAGYDLKQLDDAYETLYE